MKKIFLILCVLLSVSLFGEVGGGKKKSQCSCLGDPKKNDGSCVSIVNDPLREGAKCSESNGNKDCYGTMCSGESPVTPPAS
ncbi:MAG: hypothetical protein H6Q25_249 [Bacteroidetes bacterium]|jgi:hypothetical protein|nr:hypothetical protein [Bacteroidota bacterium]